MPGRLLIKSMRFLIRLEFEQKPIRLVYVEISGDTTASGYSISLTGGNGNSSVHIDPNSTVENIVSKINSISTSTGISAEVVGGKIKLTDASEKI